MSMSTLSIQGTKGDLYLHLYIPQGGVLSVVGDGARSAPEGGFVLRGKDGAGAFDFRVGAPLASHRVLEGDSSRLSNVSVNLAKSKGRVKSATLVIQHRLSIWGVFLETLELLAVVSNCPADVHGDNVLVEVMAAFLSDESTTDKSKLALQNRELYTPYIFSFFWGGGGGSFPLKAKDDLLLALRLGLSNNSTEECCTR